MIGAQGALGFAAGPFSFTFGGGAELLFAPTFSHAYWFASATLSSRGTSPSWFRGSFGGKIGIVFQSPKPDEYFEHFVSLSLPLGTFPQVLRQRIGNALSRIGPLWAQAQQVVPALLALDPRAARFGPLVRGAMAWLADAGQAGGEIANLIHQGLSKLTESADIFWDPTDGLPWGVDYAAGVSNTGSVSLTYSYYGDIGPL
jgi:hypothetical protein